jgi:DNA processing protein
VPEGYSNDVLSLLALNLVPGLGPRLTAALLERFGSAAEVIRASAQDLQQVRHIGSRLAELVSRALQKADVDAELALMEKHKVRLLALGKPGYPASLAEIHDPPHLLYVRGSIEPADTEAVALVGSRQCTPYGRRVAGLLAAGLARSGITVISGLARGIDACAHRGALEAGGRTIAVLAGGLSRIYPPEHKDLAAEVQGSGALLSETAMSQEPLPGMFPARNRLISALSRAVVIVEANERSGALVTARHAGEQGRTLLAVPGPVDGPASAGTNALLRKGAILARSAEDILEEVRGIASVAQPRSVPRSEPPGLDATQRRIWEFLGDLPRHSDEIAQHLDLSAQVLAARYSGWR